MSRYNHFSANKYKAISFSDVKVGDKFRMDKRSGNRRRSDIVMVKLSDTRYKEFKSGKEYESVSSGFKVSSYNEMQCA